MRAAAVAFLALLSIPLLAGCASDDRSLRIAFSAPDEALAPPQRPARLADALTELTNRTTRVYEVTESDLLVQSVAAGQADAAFVDTASGWYGWKWLGIDVAAATLEIDGRPYYVASAWVLNGSAYHSMADLRGARSCHTGLLTSEGTFMPLAWMLDEGLVSKAGHPDEIASIEPIFAAFFTGGARIPHNEADPYGNYQGALRCLSEGLGDVAFVKDTTPATYCGPGNAARPAWCKDLGEYRRLQGFGEVPSHPLIVSPHLLPEKRQDLVRGLLA
ncbi:MAG: PhnD/SsuA/transferrin family substrate-binding protein, partial [Halobacteriales archaeon]|nr:PhnD/SsuA/transferrin family substrate-binding protein [Halobacteriales archaeon]